MRAARCIVPLSCARSPVSYPRSRVPNRIHASGFTTAPRVVTIPIVLIKESGTSRGSYCQHHPLREALVQREKTAHSLSPARGRSIRLSLGEARTRGRENKRGQSLLREAPRRWENIRRVPNDVPEFIPPSRPSPSGEGEQRAGRVNPRRAFTHSCPIPGPFPNSPSPSLGCSKPAVERRWFMGQFRPRIKGRLSRHLARTAESIIVRGTARPVVAVANRIGHPRQLTPTAMYAADGSCGRTTHRSASSAESETTGLEEIGGSTGAESKRSKNLRCLSDGPQGRSEFRRFSRRCCAGSRFLPRLDLYAPLDQAKGALKI